MSSLKKFAIHYSHFIAGNFLVNLLGLVSFPILTRVLSREEYGIMSLISTTMFLAVAFAKAGLSDGIIRFYKEYSDTPERLTVFSSTIMIRGFLFASVSVLLYVAVLFAINTYLKISGKYLACFLIMSVTLLVRPLNIIVLNLLRVTEKTIFYNVVNLIGKITSIAGSLFLLLYAIGQFYGYFIGLVISELIVSIVLFYWFFSHYRVELNRMSKGLVVQLIKFGIPLLISELSYLLLAYVDRYMIAAYMGQEALGLYSVGYNLASYISDMIMFSLSAAIIPVYVGIYEKEGREKTEEFLKRCLRYLLIAIIPITAGYFAVSRELFIVLASQKYAASTSFSPIVLVGSLILGMNNILNAGLYLQKKSKSILAVMFLAMIVNVIMNIMLLPAYGVMGAAVSTLAACVFATSMTVVLAFRHIVVKFDIKTIVFYTLLSLLMYFIVAGIGIQTIWLSLMVKILVGSMIVIPTVLLREKDIRVKIMGLIPLKNLTI